MREVCHELHCEVQHARSECGADIGVVIGIDSESRQKKKQRKPLGVRLKEVIQTQQFARCGKKTKEQGQNNAQGFQAGPSSSPCNLQE